MKGAYVGTCPTEALSLASVGECVSPVIIDYCYVKNRERMSECLRASKHLNKRTSKSRILSQKEGEVRERVKQ